jgi:hypothetical protein
MQMRVIMVIVGALVGVCAGSVLMGSTVAQALIANDVMNFHFDELPPAGSFDDKSAVNVSGSCSGGAECPGVGGTGLRGTPHNNNVKRAADFNGWTDCIKIPDRAEHSLSLGSGVSFSVWVLPRSLPGIGGASAFVSKYKAAGDQREWILGIRNQNGSPHLAFWKSSLGTSSSTTAVYSNRVLGNGDLNRWMYVALRINSSRQYEWWVNGSLDASGSLSSTSFKAGTAPTRIGCIEGSTTAPDMFFHGKIDELLVAKSYMSSTAIQRLYAWSLPTVPFMAHVAGIAWGLPLAEQKPVDVPELASRIQQLGMDFYRFIIRADGKCEPACKDFDALKQLLKYFVTNRITTRVIVERNPFWLTVRPDGADQACLDAYDENEPAQHVKQWACAIAKLAADYPDHLVGWSIDDFFVPRPSGNPEVRRSFSNRAYALTACRELRNPEHEAPDLKMYTTMYCEPVGNANDMITDYQVPQWWQGATASPSWADAFVDYLTKPDGARDLAEMRECIDGVNVYTDPARFAGQNAINECIDTLRALQIQEPILEIIEGVYVRDVGGLVTEPSTESGLCEMRKDHVDASRLTVPDGFIFYEMLSTDDGCIHDYNQNYSAPERPNPVQGCQSNGSGPADDYGFCGMRTKTRSAATYIQY